MEISINGKKINYIKEGIGPKVVFVHGWGGSSNSLLELHNLAKTQFTSVLIDLPGFGMSDMPEETWGTQEYGDLLANFLKALDFKDCIYIGHSFGGALGVYIANKYPEIVSQLVLLAPAFRRVKKEYKQIKSPFYKKIKKHLWPLRKIYYKWRYPGSEALLIPKLEENFSRIVSYDLTDYLKNIKQPVLVIWGENDQLTPISHLEFVKKYLPSAQIEIYKNIGHGFPLRESKKTYGSIANFLKGTK